MVMLVIMLRLYFFCKYISDVEGCKSMSRLKKKKSQHSTFVAVDCAPLQLRKAVCLLRRM